MWAFIVQTKIGRALAAALLLCAFAGLAYHQIRQSAFEEAEHDALQGTLRAEQQRKQDDAYLQGLDDYHLCSQYFGAFRLRSAEECEHLRRVLQE